MNNTTNNANITVSSLAVESVTVSAVTANTPAPVLSREARREVIRARFYRLVFTKAVQAAMPRQLLLTA